MTENRIEIEYSFEVRENTFAQIPDRNFACNSFDAERNKSLECVRNVTHILTMSHSELHRARTLLCTL